MRNHLMSSLDPKNPGCAGLFLLAGCLVGTLFFGGIAVADAPEVEKSEKTILVPEGVAYIPDVTYCRFDDQTTLEMDIAYPSRGVGPFPAVVFLHGGGWVLGDRKNMTTYLMSAAKAGYVAVAISYRFAPRHPFPAQVQDSKCAVRFLRANAAKYKIDPDRIGAVGFSAGGNLACMLGSTNGKEFKLSGGNLDQSDRVQAVVNFYGMIDLPELDRCRKDMPLTESVMISYSLTQYLGGSCEKCKDRYAEASPSNCVNKQTVPTFLVHGKADKLVPPGQSRSYAAKLQKAGVDVSLIEVDDAGHNFGGEKEQDALKAMLKFLDKQLNRKGVADTAAGK